MKFLPSTICPLQILCLCFGLPFVSPGTAAGAEASYLTISLPGALGTFPMAINNAMTVTGYYATSPSSTRAFIRDASGTITTFSIRGGLWTEPEGINDAGDITGFYELVAGVPQSFIRYASGRVVTFDPPPGVCDVQPESQPIAINNFGEVAGNYPHPCYATSGFIRLRTGVLDTDVFFNPVSTGGPAGILGLNANGTVVGYATTDSFTGSFYKHADGYTAAFSLPLPAGVPSSSERTVAEGINDDGVIAGWYSYFPYSGNGPVSGGFVRSLQGEFTLFDPPGVMVPPALSAVFVANDPLWFSPKSLSLNASGVIAGTYTDKGGVKHGFVRDPYGTITSFDPPNGRMTTATGLNDAGAIAGFFYYDWNPQSPIGFVRIFE